MSLLHALVFAVKRLGRILSGLIQVNSSLICGKWLFIWFFFPWISCSSVESSPGQLGSARLSGRRQLKARLSIMCINGRLEGKQFIAGIKKQSDPVTILSDNLLTYFAWPTPFLTLHSSPGPCDVHRLTVFSPKLSLLCLVCQDSQPECLPKVGKTDDVFLSAWELSKEIWENNAAWGGVKISVRLPFLSTGTLASSRAVYSSEISLQLRNQSNFIIIRSLMGPWGDVPSCSYCLSVAFGSENGVELLLSDSIWVCTPPFEFKSWIKDLGIM